MQTALLNAYLHENSSTYLTPVLLMKQFKLVSFSYCFILKDLS